MVFCDYKWKDEFGFWSVEQGAFPSNWSLCEKRCHQDERVGKNTEAGRSDRGKSQGRVLLKELGVRGGRK